MFTYILYSVFILACIILVVVILLQPGKADAGALFSNTISSTAFGPRGTASLLAKITIGAAAAFMLIALTLNLPIFKGARSILESTPENAPVAAPSPSPAAEASPAATQQAAPATSPAAPAASPAATK